LSLCTTAHPLYTGFTNIFGASIFEATTRPNSRRAAANAKVSHTLDAARAQYGVLKEQHKLELAKASREAQKQAEARRNVARFGVYPIITLEKQLLNMIGNLV
jgi:hypothetical protein